MKNMIWKMLLITLAVISMILIMTGCGNTGTEEAQDTTSAAAESTDSNAEQEQAAEAVTAGIKKISKHGNVALDTTFDAMKACNIEVGDIITAYIGDKEFELPVGTFLSCQAPNRCNSRLF